jgi:hypothetical protein
MGLVKGHSAPANAGLTKDEYGRYRDALVKAAIDKAKRSQKAERANPGKPGTPERREWEAAVEKARRELRAAVSQIPERKGETGPALEASVREIIKMAAEQETAKAVKKAAPKAPQGPLLPVMDDLPTEPEKPKRKPGGAYTQDFEMWFASYPRRVAKAAAFKAWQKVIPWLAMDRECTREQAREIIIKATHEFARSSVGQGQFCPHPATWLNEGRYDDDPREWQGRAGKDYEVRV